MTSTTAPTDSLERGLAAALGRLVSASAFAYADRGDAASEPTAWATVSLARAGLHDHAVAGAEWLANRQAADGSVGVTESQDAPYWPTALAMLAWGQVDAARYADRIAAGAVWALEQTPWTTDRNRLFGHDTSLAGWSWAPDTHSWVEPTAFFSVALREAGFAEHPRRLEAVRMLVDRLLPSGGANYGNTIVFGQELLQHVQTSGVAAWALADETVVDGRLTSTLGYLREAIQQPTGSASLAWAVRGLAAHGQADVGVRSTLANAWPQFELSAGQYRTALFALATQEAIRS